MVFRTCPVLVRALFSANLAFASNSQCSDFNTAAAQVFEISQYQDARIATYASGFAVEEELLENVSRFTNITVGSMPPPRANQQPGENWFYLCMAKEGLGWNELKSIVQEYLSGEILGEEAREKLQDAIDCYERQSTAPPSEDIEKTETRLPPPLFVYGSSRNAGNTTLVVRAVYDNAEDVEIASAPFYDYGFGDNRQSYPFGVGGILIGPGHIGPLWNPDTSPGPCAFSATTAVGADGAGNTVVYHKNLVIAAGGVDEWPRECYKRKCAYLNRKQFSGGYSLYYDVNEARKVVSDGGKDYDGTRFRVSYPEAANAYQKDARVRVSFVDSSYGEVIIEESQLEKDSVFTTSVPLNTSKVDGCPEHKDDKCVRYTPFNTSLAEGCGICISYLVVTVWSPVLNPNDGSVPRECLLEDVPFLKAFDNSSIAGGPSCVPHLPFLVISCEAEGSEDRQPVLWALLIILIIFGTLAAIVCIFDVVFIPLRSGDAKANSAGCLPKTKEFFLKCFCCEGIKAFFSNLWSWTKFICYELWMASSNTPPGKFPLQVVIAFILWFPLMLTYLQSIDELLRAFARFAAYFIDGGEPLLVQTRDTVSLSVGCIILYGILLMIASWHLSWTAREIAIGHARPNTIYQWARGKNEKARAACCTRYADRRSENLGEAAHGGPLNSCCRMMGSCFRCFLDTIVYCPHCCMILVVIVLFILAIVLAVAAVPVRGIAELLDLPVNDTNVELLWENLKSQHPEDGYNWTVVKANLKEDYDAALAAPCVPSDQLPDVDRWSIEQMVLLPIGGAFAYANFASELTSEEDADEFRKTVSDLVEAYSMAYSAPDEYKPACRRKIFLYSLQLDVVRLFLKERATVGFSILSGITKKSIRFYSFSEELSDTMRDLSDECKGLVAPTVLALIAMGLSINVWARTYGFLKGMNHAAERAAAEVSASELAAAPKKDYA